MLPVVSAAAVDHQPGSAETRARRSLLRAALAYLSSGPPGLRASLGTEWRLVIVRWLGIAFMLPALPLLNLAPDRLRLAYVLLCVASIYNGLVQRTLRRNRTLFINGYFTTLGDALLTVGMVTLGGGFGTPMYFLLFTVTIASAMRFGYGPATAVAVTFVGADAIERTLSAGLCDGSFVVRSGFLVLTEMLASYLREQAARAERALKAQLRQATYDALHDSLTGLPNRTLLTERLEHALRTSAATGEQVAVMYIDLDHLKKVNDTFGHSYGDLLLREAARRLALELPSTATLARLSDDEFAAVLPSTGRESATRVAGDILRALGQPALLREVTVDVSASIGIAIAPEHGADADVLQRRADVAMCVAKLQRSDSAIYTPEQDRHSRERLALAGDLRRAIQRGELFLHYQPIVCLRSGRMTEVEALVRWNHPTRGMISPAEFIPLAEETGVIVSIGQWVMQQACAQAAIWRSEYESAQSFVMSVNVSARQFQSVDIVEDVRSVLLATGLAPDGLKLEITESVTMGDPELSIASLWALKGIGVRLAIDDFGTGYSSLAYLKRFPADTLKIDKVFIDGLGVHPEDAAIVSATIAFARAVGLTTTVEGIETVEQLAHVRQLGADRVQGYFYSRPLAAEDMGQLFLRGGSLKHRERLHLAAA